MIIMMMGWRKKMRSMFCTVVRMALICYICCSDPSMHVNESSSSNFFFPSSDMPMLIWTMGQNWIDVRSIPRPAPTITWAMVCRSNLTLLHMIMGTKILDIDPRGPNTKTMVVVGPAAPIEWMLILQRKLTNDNEGSVGEVAGH